MQDLTFERGLPTAPHAERALLGAILTGNDTEVSGIITSGILPEDFALEKHRRIFAACRQLHDAGELVERVGVAEYLAGIGQLESVDGLTYLCELGGESIPGLSVDGWVATVQEKALQRKAIMGCQAVINHALDQMDTPGIVDQITRLTEQLQAGIHVREPLPSVGQIVERAGIEAIFGGAGAETIPSPWPTLNQIIGGFERGQMVCIGGRPSQGKSVALCQIAKHTAGLGKTAVIFSLEMSKVSLIQRMVASECSVPLWRVRGGHMDPMDVGRTKQALASIVEIPSLLIADSVQTIAAMRAALARLSARTKVDLVAVDYLQLMAGTTQRNRVEEITGITRGLKLLSEQFECTLVVASQLSRESAKVEREPELYDLRDCGSIEQDSDLVIFPYRIPRQNEDEINVDTDFIVRKQRNGRLGRVKMVFEKPQVRFREA